LPGESPILPEIKTAQSDLSKTQKIGSQLDGPIRAFGPSDVHSQDSRAPTNLVVRTSQDKFEKGTPSVRAGSATSSKKLRNARDKLIAEEEVKNQLHL
jgi:hypothetical protein